MVSKRVRAKQKEKVRNVLLVILALGMVVIFFNLDITNKGESVFSKTSSQKLRFSGDLKKNAYTKDEVSQLIRFISKYGEEIVQVKISTTLQDTYRKVTDRSQIIFEVSMIMDGGATINTPTKRSTRGELVEDILAKMHKDVTAYIQLKNKGKKIKSLVNTM